MHWSKLYILGEKMFEVIEKSLCKVCACGCLSLVPCGWWCSLWLIIIWVLVMLALSLRTRMWHPSGPGCCHPLPSVAMLNDRNYCSLSVETCVELELHMGACHLIIHPGFLLWKRKTGIQRRALITARLWLIENQRAQCLSEFPLIFPASCLLSLKTPRALWSSILH